MGSGPITALCFKATTDDPTRFKRSRSVGAYWINDQTSCLRRARLVRSNIEVWRRHAPHVSVRSGRRTADPRAEMVSAEGLGLRLTKRNGLRKAKVAVARKLAVILHRMWIDGTEFNWSSKEVTA